MVINAFDAKISCLKLADGSCEWSERGIAVSICGINGPGDVPSSRRLLDRTCLSFTFSGVESKREGKSARGVSLLSSASATASSSRPFIEGVIANVVDREAYPRTGLQVCVQELHNTGSVATTAAMLNCIYLALLDASVKLHYCLAAVRAVLFNDSSFSLTLTHDGEDDRLVVATFTFVFKASPATMVGDEGGPSAIACEATGKFHTRDYLNALKAAKSASSAVFNLHRRVMEEKFIHRLPSNPAAEPMQYATL